MQDTWTRDRLTLQGALRYDRAWSLAPAEGNGTTRRRGSTRRRSRSTGRRASTPTTTSRRASASRTTCSATARRPSSSTSAATSRRRRTTRRYTQNNPANRDRQRRLAELDRRQRQLRRRLRHPESGGADRARRRHLRRVDRRRPELRQDRRNLDAGQPGHAARLGRPPVRLAVGRQLQQQLAAARLAGRRLQPPLVRELHGDGQPGASGRRTTRSGRSPRRWIAPAGRRRLPDRRLHADSGGRRRGAAQNYVTLETDFGPSAHQLLARRGRHRERAAAAAASTLQGGTSTGRVDHRHLRRRGQHRQPGSAQLPQRGTVPDDVPRPGVVHVPKIDVLVSGTLRSQPPLQVGTPHHLATVRSTNVPNTWCWACSAGCLRGRCATGNTR